MSIVQQAEPIAALCVIVLLVLGSGRIAKRFLPGSLGLASRASGGITVGASVAIDANRRLVVIGHEHDRFLVLLGRNGDVSLGRLGEHPQPPLPGVVR